MKVWEWECECESVRVRVWVWECELWVWKIYFCKIYFLYFVKFIFEKYFLCVARFRVPSFDVWVCEFCEFCVFRVWQDFVSQLRVPTWECEFCEFAFLGPKSVFLRVAIFRVPFGVFIKVSEGCFLTLRRVCECVHGCVAKVWVCGVARFRVPNLSLWVLWVCESCWKVWVLSFRVFVFLGCFVSFVSLWVLWVCFV